MSRSSRLAGRAFSPLAMIIVVLVGVVSLAGLGVLSAYAPELKKGDDGGVHALSNSSGGFGGSGKSSRSGCCKPAATLGLSAGRLAPVPAGGRAHDRVPA